MINYETHCIWCEELYAEVNHELGCPEPKLPLSEAAKRQLKINEALYEWGKELRCLEQLENNG